MFVSFCLIMKYPWVLNQLSLNWGIVPGSGLAPNGRQAISLTNDDLASLMQICLNNNSNNNNSNSESIFSRVKQMTSIYFYTIISQPQRPHISNVHL